MAEGVCAYLEEHRIKCFLAYRDIPKEVVWAKQIVEALDESSMMVVVFSENFNRSDQVDREIELASEDKKPILTFRICDEPFNGAKKYYLKNLNWIDAFPNPEMSFGRLCENIMRLLEDDAIEKPEEYTSPTLGPETVAISVEKDEPTLQQKNNTICLFENRLGVENDFWFRKSAEQGNAGAQFRLGYCYYRGEGVERNYTQAVYWYRKSVEQGNSEAQYRLGKCYYWGEGVERDYTQAVYWYRKSAEQGNAEAQLYLGYCYYKGEVVEQNYIQAVCWFRKSAEQGIASAQYNLGYCYYNGKGVEQNYALAVYWYRKAAEQGDVDAQYALGRCYDNGEGVEQNDTQAEYWYGEAAQNFTFTGVYKLGYKTIDIEDYEID